MNIYHYCSNNTFYKIINNHQLWMTDITRSNDYEEMRMFIPPIFVETEEAYKEKPFQFRYKNKNGLEALQHLLHETHNIIMKSINSGRLTSYVVCFSEEKDLLSQWRGYADNGKGCSVGFALDDLKHFCAQSNDTIAIEKVDYINRGTLKEVLQEKVSKILPEIAALRENTVRYIAEPKLSEKEREEMMLVFSQCLFENIVFDSLKYKWDDYKEEHEWRMFFKSITKDEKTLFAEEKDIPSWRVHFDRDYQTQHGKIDFYAKEDCIIPYFPVKLEDLSESPVKEIILGPQNKSHIQDIMLFFAKQKLGKPGIRYSNISYR